MKLYQDGKPRGTPPPNPVVTMGNFDGIHRGHQAIFHMLSREAEAGGGNPLVITFFPHPLQVLCPERAPRLITSLQDRIRLIQACGIRHVLLIPFTKEFAQWDPERFIREILVDKLGTRKVLVGEGFRFGRHRSGDLALLKEKGREYGYEVQQIGPVQVDGREVSSTRIRHCIESGLLRESASMLGRFYGISGKVVSGEHRGKGLGFPTANLQTEAELLPPNGVYAVWTRLGADQKQGVANLGMKPTFSGRRFSIEVYILDFSEDIYGTTLHLDFVERIREERAFPDPEALVRQIRRDVEAARRILGEDSITRSESPFSAKADLLP